MAAVIEVQHLHKRYGDTVAVGDVSFTVHEGEIFFAGLWLPIPDMPKVLQHISHATPLGAAVPALQNAALGQWPTWLQLLTMAGYAVAFGLAAARFFRWE